MLEAPWTAPDEERNAPLPGPKGQEFKGPWLQQQILFSCAIGLVSLVVFWAWRRRLPSLFLGRYREQGAALPYATMRKSFVRWIAPVLLYSDHSVLHTVGIDGAVALLFLKMGFAYFALLAAWAALVLMPVNYYTNGWIDGVEKGERADAPRPAAAAVAGHGSHGGHAQPGPPLPYLPMPRFFTRDTLYEYTHLVTTYISSILAMYVLWRTYTVFIRLRQGHIRQQVQSDTTRTVEVREIPEHLASHDALTAYFAELRLEVAHVSILQDTKELDRLLLERTRALQRLERTWAAYVGDPARAEHYDPAAIARETEAIDAPPAPRAAPRIGRDVVVPRRARPTLSRGWPWPLGSTVDAIDELSYRFAELDRAARARREARFRNGHTAFVTFTYATHAQIASQVVHYPLPGLCTTEPAVEPRDIIWVNEEPGLWDRRARQLIMTLLMALLLSLTLGLSATLAAIFRMDTIERYAPWLAEMLRSNVRFQAFATYSMPALLLIAINALVPVAMHYSTYFQRIRSRSHIDHSVLNKYFLYLIFSVVFVFAFSDARQMLKELTQNPEQMIDKLAQSLLPVARNFSLSYVIFQGLALQPFQLVQLPSLLAQLGSRLFVVHTPRARAHAIQPPVLSVGTLYPQALLIFTLSLLYSIVSPLIVVFGAVYFAMAYLVLKYQLLNVLAKPYDSHGHAWPLAVTRCIWALLLFQTFQFSLFSFRQQVVNSVLVLPLFAFTVWFLTNVRATFAPLTEHLSLYDIYATYDADEHTHSPRPAEDAHHEPDSPTPFEPALAWNHRGTLSTKSSQYGQPALTGQLPTLWLPAKPNEPQMQP
ncbi:hypothetical protein MOBT1_000007 [Malassezia obtusa]|uniref:DUF221-domain-containing protein n=1 Tax=Malassezia obtusa TaxID=76774 RepID=A0AAF0DXP2_9BASI|nr:hypothetical protein MOBT1_000007 [Malassezia obtusa]